MKRFPIIYSSPSFAMVFSNQRPAAAAAGATAAAAAAAFGAVASSQWDDAQSQCEEPPYGCGTEGVVKGQDAQTSATVSTVGFIVGGVGIAAGVVLWLTAPSGEPPAGSAGRTRTVAGTLQNVHLTPTLSTEQQGLQLQGRF